MDNINSSYDAEIFVIAEHKETGEKHTQAHLKTNRDGEDIEPFVKKIMDVAGGFHYPRELRKDNWIHVQVKFNFSHVNT